MQRIWAVSILLALVGMPAGRVLAAFTNGGFETGDTTGWTASPAPNGSISVVSAFGPNTFNRTYTPTEGNFFAVLAAGSQGIYSMLSQPFSASPGEVLSFDYFFASDEPQGDLFHDQGDGLLLNGDSGGLVATLFHHQVFDEVNDSIVNNQVNDSNIGSHGSIPWTPISTTILAAGNYVLQFRVDNEGDGLFPSYVGADNVRITNGHTTPEPASLLIWGTLGLLLTWRMRTKRTPKHYSS